MSDPTRTLIFGNSGSGKSTYAKALAEQIACPHLDLDSIAWDPSAATPTRRALPDSAADIAAFTRRSDAWVIEGCYADLLELAMAKATTVVFLNPGVETCIANARNRPWEPHKYPSPEAQNANLDMLVAWIRDYAERDDEFSLAAHRRLFDAFKGPKREFTSNERGVD